jgi:hypothetical protein
VKATGRQLKELRKILFEIILLLMKAPPGLLPENIHVIMGFLVQTPDATSKVETLQLLQVVLHDDACHAVSLLGLSTCNGVQIILGLTSHVRPKVRLNALLVLCRVLHLATQYRVLPPVPSESRLMSEFEELKRPSLPTLILAQDDEKDELLSGSQLTSRKSTVLPRSLSTSSGSDTMGEIPRVRKVQECNTWDALQIPVGRLQHVLVWVVVQLSEALQSDFLSKHSVDTQIKIAIEVFQHILLARPADHLSDTVDSLYPDFKETTPLSDTRHSKRTMSAGVMDPIQIPKSPSFLDIDVLICIPMALPALLYLLGQDVCSAKLRLSAVVNVKALLSNPHNCEMILRLPVWQEPILALFASSLSRLAFGAATTIKADKNEQKEGALLDTCLRMLCDIQIHAVRFGAPMPSPCVMSNAEACASMTGLVERPMARLEEVKLGKRRVGVSVLRETVSYLRCYGEDGEMSTYPTGINLLQQTVIILKREIDSQSAAAKNSSSDIDIQLSQRILQLNVWLIAAVVLEFLAMPAIKRLPSPIDSEAMQAASPRTPPHSKTPSLVPHENIALNASPRYTSRRQHYFISETLSGANDRPRSHSASDISSSVLFGEGNTLDNGIFNFRPSSFGDEGSQVEFGAWGQRTSDSSLVTPRGGLRYSRSLRIAHELGGQSMRMWKSSQNEDFFSAANSAPLDDSQSFPPEETVQIQVPCNIRFLVLIILLYVVISFFICPALAGEFF